MPFRAVRVPQAPWDRSAMAVWGCLGRWQGGGQELVGRKESLRHLGGWPGQVPRSPGWGSLDRAWREGVRTGGVGSRKRGGKGQRVDSSMGAPRFRKTSACGPKEPRGSLTAGPRVKSVRGQGGDIMCRRVRVRERPAQELEAGAMTWINLFCSLEGVQRG